MTSPISGTEGYAENAGALAAQYESITFEKVYAPVLHLMPFGAASAMDVGAGSGRDAAALARRGLDVTAVEPVSAFREIAARLHKTEAIRWVDDSLPELAKINAPFDFILAGAVWMHLDENERHLSMSRFGRLLNQHGGLVLTLRHGPVPAGRRMFDVSGGETCALAHEMGLKNVYEGNVADPLGRGDVHWTFLAFRNATRQ